MPRPMSTMPMASHPKTPAEIIVSSVIRESDWFELLEDESFISNFQNEQRSCR